LATALKIGLPWRKWKVPVSHNYGPMAPIYIGQQSIILVGREAAFTLLGF
jgi:hypothetical protein